MAHDAREVANWLIERGKKDERYFTVTQLMMLTFIAHGRYLEKYNTPLISNKIVAWKFGPVIVEVYHAFEKYDLYVTDVAVKYLGSFTPTEEDFLEQFYDIYGQMHISKLEALTHIEDGPWDVAIQAGGFYARIPNTLIKHHYRNVRVEEDKQEEVRQAAVG